MKDDGTYGFLVQPDHFGQLEKSLLGTHFRTDFIHHT